MELKPCFDTWDRQDEGYVFISEKSQEEWQDHPFKWPEERDKLEKFVKGKGKTNLYWAPLVFTTRRRKIEYVRPGNTLFADLDPVDPYQLDPAPTIAWESSPGRYQALWWLDKALEPAELGEINKAQTYRIGADKGGWDLTQVLRIPGSYNCKTNPPKRGKLLWTGNTVYNKETFPKQMPTQEQRTEVSLVELLSRYRRVIPAKVSKLLQYPQSRVEPGNRSDMLWYIEAELIKAQIPMEDIIWLVKLSAWNKYKGRNDEWKRLTTEITKVYQSSQEEDPQSPEEQEMRQAGLPWQNFPTIMSSIQSRPGWLVKDLWMRRSHGIIAGEPKTFKSTIALDLAVSVASGKPLWEKFTVEDQGPVMIVQNENAEWIIKDRLEKILNHKKLVGHATLRGKTMEVKFAPELPMYFLNNYGYSFSDPLHMEEMEQAIAEIKPVLIIFDPLYLMFEGEINSAKDLQPILFWLLELRNRYNTAVMVVHHWNKGGTSSRGGQRMLGSTTLHGWTESALYIQSQEDSEGTTDGPVAKVIIEREFRAAGMLPKLELQIKMGAFGTPLYEPRFEEVKTLGTLVELLDLLSVYPNGISTAQAAKELGVSRRKIDTLIEKSGGKIKVSTGARNSKIIRLEG